MKMIQRLFIKYSVEVCIAVLAIYSVIALFHTGLPPTHDGEYHVIRFYEFDRALQGGDTYPRWAKDLNFSYGIPLFNFVYPLPNYISSFLHIFSFSFIDTFKIEMILATVIGSVFFYLWSKEYWGIFGGFISAVLYIFTPYRFLDIFIRGSVGEVLALSIFPIFLWSLKKYSQDKEQRYFILSACSLSLVIFSHNILGLLFFAFAIFYNFVVWLSEGRNKSWLLQTVFIYLFALGLSAIFWIPALFEKQLTVGLEVFNYQDHFPTLGQLIIPSWGSGFSGVSAKNQMSFQIGVVNLLSMIGILFVFVKFSIQKKYKVVKLIAFFIFILVCTIFIMLPVSSFLWKIIPLLSFFQFPWRFLSIVTLVIPFLAGSTALLIASYGRPFKIGIAIVILGMSIFATRHYNKVPYFLERSDQYYTTRSNFIDGTNSPGNAFNTKWANQLTQKPVNKLDILHGNGTIRIIQEENSFYTFNINSVTQSTILANIAYFPGWSVYVDKKQVPTKITSKGLFTFSLNPGTHIVAIILKDTPFRLISGYITLISLILLLFHGTMRKRWKY